mgnify:CR=1 FL=1
MKFVLATHNPGKLREMSEILSHLGVEVVSPADVGITVRWRRPAPPSQRTPC